MSDGSANRADVLVVDDDGAIRLMIARILRRAGYACTEAKDPETALVVADEQSVDLVLCDVNMPGGSGLDLVRELRARHRDVAVLMVSGVDDPRTASSAVDSGAYGYIVKPFQTNEILIAAENALRRRQLEIENRSHRERLERLVAERTADLARTAHLERLQRTLLDHMSGGVIMQDMTGEIVAVNPATLRLLGLTSDELSGRPGLDPSWRTFRPDGTAWPRQELPGAVTRRTGLDQQDQLVGVVHPDGHQHWLSISTSVARDEEGRPGFVVASLADVTSEQSARLTAAGVREQGRRHIEDLIDQRQVRMVFQPIVDIGNGAVVGVEALARFPGTPGRPPDIWFAEAAELGLGTELELAAIEAALADLPRLSPDVYMSLNVSPATVGDDRLIDLLGRASSRNLVLELTEHVIIGEDAYLPLADWLAPLRSAGVRIAVDDAGAGYASLRHILNLSPDIIKLDIGLTRGIDTDPARRALATALLRFGSEISAVIVAEGIETDAELAALQMLGIGFGQGYHLGLPASLSSTALDMNEYDDAFLLGSSV